MTEIFEFSNGVRVYAKDLLLEQRIRYTGLGSAPLHEPVEEYWLRVTLESIPGKAPIFVDIGSALGYYSILVKKVAPWFRVISVDPNPHFHERHTRTVELNGLAEGDIELVKRAVYSRSGYVDFANKDFSSFVCSMSSHDESNIAGIIQVEAVTVCELVEGIKGHVDLMKIDIQGTELEVFKCADISTLSENVSNIIVGTHGKSVHGELIKILSRSYRIAFEDECPVHQPDGIIVAHSRRRRY